MDFGFYCPSRIEFGKGRIEKVGEFVKTLGNCAFIIASHCVCQGKIRTMIESSLGKAGIDFRWYQKPEGEPSPLMVEGALLALKGFGDKVVVVAIGGGSVIDLGKAVAGMYHNEGNIKDYLEGVGTGRVMTQNPLPWICIPTTSGTGAEVTKNAVISDTLEGYKKSFRDDRLYARIVILDSMVLTNTPKKVTACSGMDALTQLIESYTSRRATPLTSGLALIGLQYARSLLRAYDEGENENERENMALAALISGMCLANSGLGAVHGIGAALGIHLGLSHGLACAILLPHVIEVNANYTFKEYACVAEALGLEKSVQSLQAYIKSLNAHFGIPKDLHEFALTNDQLLAIAKDSFGSSMSGNPVQLDVQGWYEVLKSIA